MAQQGPDGGGPAATRLSGLLPLSDLLPRIGRPAGHCRAFEGPGLRTMGQGGSLPSPSLRRANVVLLHPSQGWHRSRNVLIYFHLISECHFISALTLFFWVCLLIAIKQGVDR